MALSLADTNDLPAIHSARLPVSYEKAKAALDRCQQLDECADWKNKAEAIASYARQSRDESLLNTAQRIKVRAERRVGELLRVMEPAKPGPKAAAKNSVSAPVPNRGRADVAKAAGLSKRQQVQATRIANIPAKQFEALVEQPKPPTATELAKLGTNTKPVDISYLNGRTPDEFNRGLHARGTIKECARKLAEHKPADAVRKALGWELKELRTAAKDVAAWLERLEKELDK